MVFSSNPGTSVLVRLRFLEGSWRLFKSSPILGRGTGGFAGVSNLRYPHNVFAELASENGIVPVVLLMALVIQAIRLATRAMGGLRDSVGDFVFGGLLLSLVNALFSGDLTTNQPLYAFAAIAAVLAATVSGSECAAARSSGSVASDHGVLSSGESRA
jgi:O-antigen ligase